MKAKTTFWAIFHSHLAKSFFLITISFAAFLNIYATDISPTKSLVVIPKLYVNLYVVKNDGSVSLSDGVASTYYSTYHNAVDGQDAPKLNSFNTRESLCILRDGVQLSVEKRQPIQGHDTTYLQLMQMDEKQYQIQFVPQNFDNSLVAFLKDEYTGQVITIDLSKGDTVNYTFKITPPIVTSNELNRFSVEFAPINELPVNFTSIDAVELNKAINIDWTVENEINIDHYAIQKSTDGTNFATIGTLLPLQLSGNTKKYTWSDLSIDNETHFYRIIYQNKNGSQAFSKTIKISAEKTTSSINVYPTIIDNGQFDLQFVNMKKGMYNLRMINNIGQVVFAKSIQHSGGSSVQNISVKTPNKGIYYVTITNNTDKFYTSSTLFNQ